MRSFVRHALVVGTCLGALVASSGCEQKKATEYVTGISTQVSVPKNLRSVRIQVLNKGFVEFCQGYRVYNGKVLLPRSLGNYPISTDSNRNTVTFSIVGLTDDFSESSENPIFSDCQSAATVKANNVRILRRSTQPYVPDKILFLPMALKYSCFDKVCDKEGETCKGGLCVSENTDPGTLQEYTEGMGDGADAACFSVPICTGPAIPAVPVNDDTCDFALAESKDVGGSLPKGTNPFRPLCTTSDQCGGRPCNDGWCDLLPAGVPSAWDGLNVEVTYDGGTTKEILDLDAQEGFTIPDPNKPQTFRLAPGLCQLFKGTDEKGLPTAHRITSIRASGTCAPKLPSQQLCVEDQLKAMGANSDGDATDVTSNKCTTSLLTPSKSALVLVVDDTQGHAQFFGKDVQDQLAAPLQDPAFERTEIGYLYSNNAIACQSQVPVIKPALGPEGATKIITDFTAKAGALSPETAPKIGNSLQSAYKFLGELDDTYARRAVVVLGNRDLEAPACSEAKSSSQLAEDNFKKPTRPIATFASKLTSAGEANAAQLIADKGSPHDKDNLIPYQFNAQTAQDKKQFLQAVINYLATCLYDVESGAKPATDATLSYANPLLASEVRIEHVASCEGNTSGWTLDESDAARPRVKICGAACTDYQKVLSDTSTFTLLYNQPSMPVPLYVSTKACFQKVE